VVWHLLLPLMNIFNKTETAVFPCRLYFLEAFHFTVNFRSAVHNVLALQSGDLRSNPHESLYYNVKCIDTFIINNRIFLSSLLYVFLFYNILFIPFFLVKLPACVVFPDNSIVTPSQSWLQL